MYNFLVWWQVMHHTPEINIILHVASPLESLWKFNDTQLSRVKFEIGLCNGMSF